LTTIENGKRFLTTSCHYHSSEISDAGLFMLFLGLFMAWTTWSLYRTIENKQIFHHPVFAPDCYRLDGRSPTNLSHSVPPTQGTMSDRPKNSTTISKEKTNDRDIESGRPLKSKTKRPSNTDSGTKKNPTPKKKSAPKKKSTASS
jgi:hypothetical protein